MNMTMCRLMLSTLLMAMWSRYLEWGSHFFFCWRESTESKKIKKVMFSEFFLQRMQYIEGFCCLNLAAQRGSNRSLERLQHKHLYSQESKSTSASANSWLDRTPWPICWSRPWLWPICDKNNVFFLYKHFSFSFKRHDFHKLCKYFPVFIISCKDFLHFLFPAGGHIFPSVPPRS